MSQTPQRDPGRVVTPRTRRSAAPTQWLLTIALALPALWIGGGVPSAVPASALALAALALERWWTRARWRWPVGLGLALGLIGLTLLSLLPLPPSIHALVAPRATLHVERALAGLDAGAWRPLSLGPAATWLELGELLALAVAFLLAAQCSWRRVAGAVLVTASIVAAVGLVHEVMDSTQIYGVYQPRLGRTGSSALLTSFVNPNHQASLFLLGAAAGLGLGRSLDRGAHRAATSSAAERDRDRATASYAAVGLLVIATLLSVSRGAIIVLAFTGAVAIVLILREHRAQPGLEGFDSAASSERRRATALRAMALTLPVALALGVAGLRGVWRDLLRLADPVEAGQKLAAAREGLGAWQLSPVFGVGRGAFVDAFPLVREGPASPIYTHLESVPATMFVEWGPAGLAVALALGAWWLLALRRCASHSGRLVLLGPLAVGLHGLLDFGPELLGVGVPLVAVAGAFAPSPVRRPERAATRSRGDRPRRLAFPTVMIVLGLALVTAQRGRHGSYVARRALDVELAASPAPTPTREARLIADRPLDPHLHLSLGRAHARVGDWPRAALRAEVATRLDPQAVDPWVLAGEARWRQGDTENARVFLAAGLARLATPPPPDLVALAAARFPDPEALAEALMHEGAAAPAPGGDAGRPRRAALVLARAMLVDHPRHALALARRLSAPTPGGGEVDDADRADEATLLYLQARASLAAGEHALALHHARLLAQLDPDDGRAAMVIVAALRHLHPADRDARVALLEAALERDTLREREGVAALLARERRQAAGRSP